jgi:23S rRNA (pseudouridine1915-N3)-methyltransferase
VVQVTLLAVGRLRDPHAAAWCDLYSKRLGRFVRMRTVEVKTAGLSDSGQARDREATHLLRHWDPSAATVALDVAGRGLSSEEVADYLAAKSSAGTAHFLFVIGGPFGLAPSMLERAEDRWSLSRLTFTHEMARVILLEQLYRAVTIWKGHPYHHG